MNTNQIQIQPFCPNLGAVITGLDLRQPISSKDFSVIKKAFLKYQVLFFQQQKEIPPEKQIEFGQLFGRLHSHPAAPTMKGFPEMSAKILSGRREDEERAIILM